MYVLLFFHLGDNYKEILESLLEKWIINEIDHRVSKTASENFWRIASSFHDLHVAKGASRRKIPQLGHLRKKMYKDRVPDVHMEVGFQSKDTGEVTVLDDVAVIPTSRFPTNQFRRLYEIASVDVR